MPANADTNILLVAQKIHLTLTCGALNALNLTPLRERLQKISLKNYYTKAFLGKK